MDRSLWLLMGLRAKGWVRRWARNLGSLKGTLLALVGALFFLPAIVTAFLIPRIQAAEQSALIRQHGPLGLLAYCLLNVLLSSGERALYYSPAEVNLLFSAPYRPRQLVAYRVAAGLAAAFIGAGFATLVLQHHAASPWAAFVGLFLALELCFLFSVGVSLFAGTVGVLAFNRQRKILLVAVLTTTAGLLALRGHGGVAHVLENVERSPVGTVLLMPFRPFVLAFTAERLWPDLAVGAGLSLLVDLVLLAVVIGLNFEFLEVSARVSARRYALLQRARRGAAWSESGSVRVGIPWCPWLGGVGPNLWRQLTTAARSASRSVMVLIVLGTGPLLAFLAFGSAGAQTLEGLSVPVVVLCSLTVFAPTMVGYDFRPDLDRLEQLKTLPIPPVSLVIGQLATPVLVVTLGQWLGLALIASQVGLPARALAPAALFLAPTLNVVVVGVENLFFLWFPARFIAGASADFQLLGRQFLLMVGRLACALFAAGLAAGLGALAFFIAGESWAPAIAAAWVGLAASGLGVVLLVAQAFRAFDVARDRLE